MKKVLFGYILGVVSVIGLYEYATDMKPREVIARNVCRLLLGNDYVVIKSRRYSDYYKYHNDRRASYADYAD